MDEAFAFTGRWFDGTTGLQNNDERWYDPKIGRWLSEDPIGFNGDPSNLYRYVGNQATTFVDPSGLKPWKAIGRLLGKKWSEETCERAGKTLAKELLERLATHHPDAREAKEILITLRGMGWIEGPLGKGSKAGKALEEGGGLILREIENGKETGRFLEWYPGEGPHHKDPHWKFSSGESGTLRTIGTTAGAIAIAIIPGGEQAVAGDINGAARQAAYEVSPIGWGSWVTSYFSWLYDTAESDVKRAGETPNCFIHGGKGRGK